MSLIRTLGFAAVEVALAPVTTVGYLASALGIGWASRRDKTSMTAASPLGTRWLLHETGQRDDPAAAALFRSLPGMSDLAARLTLAPTVWASRLSGHTPGLMTYPFDGPSSVLTMMNARTTVFDRALADALAHVEQVVFLGAGWDTRSLTLPASVAAYEVDAPDTQRTKRALLADAGIDAGHVVFVSADFNTETWLDRLVAEGFDPARMTFVLWEGVTYYLDPEAVTATLDAVASLAPGSQVAFDYFGWGMVNGSDAPLVIRSMRSSLRFTGEEWTFGLDMAPDARGHARCFVEAHGLDLAEWAPLGQPTKPFGGIVLATVPRVASSGPRQANRS